MTQVEPDDSPFYFNSRPSARGDMPTKNNRYRKIISIHAPPRGATQAPTPQLGGITIFQFTPLREGRPAHHKGYKRA